MSRKILSTDEFIEKLKVKRDDNAEYYGYSLVEYVGASKKIKIICPVHGVFEQIASNHVAGNGCKKCAIQTNKQNIPLTTEEFLDRLAKRREDNAEVYDYSKVVYVNNNSNIIICCPKHGDFLQKPYTHMKGSGCMRCSIEQQRKTTENFLKDAKEYRDDKGEFYDYSLVDYKTNHDKVKIVCPMHGVFKQSPNAHLSKDTGCPRCGDMKRKNTCIERYGANSPLESKEIKNKIAEKLYEEYGVYNSSHIPGVADKISKRLRRYNDDDVSDEALKAYYYRVEYQTEKSWKEHHGKINPSGFNRALHEYHIDHKFSIIQGFVQGIPAEIIGHWINLQMLYCEDNIKKSDECDISKEELLKLYEENREK